MNPFRSLHALFAKGKLERDMAEEMRFHLDQRAADLAADGLPGAEARLAAERKFGNVASLQEQVRAGRGWTWLENLLLDFRLGLRSLWKSPGFTLLAVVTLALGIGANTSTFSMLNSILLRPMPYREVDELDRFFRATAQNHEGNFSAADFRDFLRAQDGYGEVAAYGVANLSLAEPGRPAEVAYTANASTNLFRLLGIQVQLGRDFHPNEGAAGRDRVVILSQRTWLNRFGGKPDIVGRTIRLDGEEHVVVGILPASFNDWRYLGAVDLFRPLAFTPAQAADRAGTTLRILGRRAPGRPRTEAAAFVASFGARQAAEFPTANAETTWRAVPLQEAAAGRGAFTIMPMLIGLSGFVLLIACSNLANLLLARTMARAREFAVRGALGASRTQLLRPLLAEALLLALAGGGGAILLASWVHDWLAVRSTGQNGEQVHLVLDWHVAGWAFLAALGTAMVFGLAPALFALRLDLNQTLKSGGRGQVGGRGHQRFRQILIVGQFALAMALLAGASLFVRGLYDLNNRRTGWESTGLITGSILLPSAGYADGEKITAFHLLVLERLAALPGVTSASLSSFTPFFNWPEVRKYLVEGQERPQPGHEAAAAVNCVSPGYFETFRTRVLAGRAFTARDTAASPGVFIISQTMARGLFGGASALGHRLAQTEGGETRWGEIVGVVNDVQSVMAENNPILFQVYRPMAQDPRSANELAVHTAGVAPAAVIDAIRTTMADLDGDLPVRQLLPADGSIVRANYQLAVLRDVLSSIAVLGLGLASLGIYGIIARTMAQRSGEFAIRLALGASIGNLTRIVLATGVKLALAGSALGLVGALVVSRLLATGFPGMHLDSPPVLIGATLLLVGVALVACWLPARRAGQVDAMAVLRSE